MTTFSLKGAAFFKKSYYISVLSVTLGLCPIRIDGVISASAFAEKPGKSGIIEKPAIANPYGVVEAEKSLRKAVLDDPDNARALHALGLFLLNDGDVNEAETHLRKAYAIQPKDTNEIDLGRALIALNLPDRVLEIVSEKGLNDRLSAQKATIRAQAFLLKNNPASAAAILRELNNSDPGNSWVLLTNARLSFYKGDYFQATKLADASIKVDPSYKDALLFRGDIAADRGDMRMATELYETVIRLSPRNIPARLSLGRILIAQKQLKDAKFHARELMRLNPRHPAGRYLLAAAYFEEGDIEKTEIYFQSVSSQIDKAPQALVLGGTLKFALGDNAQAENFFSRYLTLRPDDAGVRRSLGYVRLRRNDYAAARESFQSVLRSLPDDLYGLQGAASAAYHERKIEEAEQLFSRIREIYPGKSPLAEAAGQLLCEADRVAEKNPHCQEPEYLERALKLFQTLDKITNDNRKKGEFAIANYRKIYQPDFEETYLIAGAHHQAGNLKEAERDYNIALNLLNHHGEVAQSDNLQGILTRLGDLDRQLSVPQRTITRLNQYIVNKKGGFTPYGLLVDLYLTEKNYDLAEKTLVKAAQSYGDEKVFLRKRLETAQILKKSETESAALKTLLKQSDQSDISYLRGLFLDYYDGKNYPFAELTAQKISEIAPASYNVLMYADILRLNGKKAQAESLLKEIAAENEDNILLINNLIAIYLETGRKEEALQFAQSLRSKNFVQSVRSEASIYAQTGQADQAIEILKNEVLLQPVDAISADLAELYLKDGKTELALSVVEEAIEALAKSPLSGRVAAGVYMRTGEFDKADAMFAKILPQFQGDAYIYNNAAIARSESGGEGALRLAEIAYNLYGKSPEIADTYGKLLTEAGNAKKAEPILTFAAEKLGTPDTLYNAAYAKTQLNKRAEAKAMLEEALKTDKPFKERRSAEALLRRLNDNNS